MSIIRYLVLLAAAFAAATVSGYLVVAITILTAWDLMNVHDQDGGGAMAVGFVIAPAGALVCGIIGLAVAATMLSRKAAKPESDQLESDTKWLVRIGPATAGLVLGWKAANYARYLLREVWYENIVFAIIFAVAPYVMPILVAGAGLLLARHLETRSSKRKEAGNEKG